MATNVLIKFSDEDHTLGSLLSTQLIEDKRTIFSAYKVPHPLFKQVEIRLETTEPAEKVVAQVIEKYREKLDKIQKIL